MMTLLFPSSFSLHFAARASSAFVTRALLFHGAIVVLWSCVGICALATCGICLESLEFFFSLLQIYN